MSLFDSASLVVTPNGIKASKLYAIKPTDGSGDLTVVRNTTATRVNSAGLIESVAVNVPRLDYTNSSCPSILVEGQRTNITLYSEQFDNASWVKSNSSVSANAIISPSGMQNADKFVENNGTGEKWLFYTPTVTPGTSYTYSVYAKKGERDFIYIYAFSGGINQTWFNLNTGTVGTSTGGTASIENVGNGWYRCTYTITTVLGTQFYILGVSNADNVPDYTGDGTSGVYIWGAQLEAGSYPTSYIPTVASAVTRNADVISKTGISSLIGQTEGTLFVDFVCNGFTDFGTPFCINDGSAANSIWITTFGDGTIRGEVFGSSNVQATFSLAGGVVGQRYKLALVYKQNDFAMYVNGNLIGSDNSGTVPANLSRADFDYVNASVFVKSALEINTAILWKTRLTNAELAELTTL